MKRNVKLLYFVWAIAVVLVIILTQKYKSRGEFTEFYGIAETREIVVNSENPVEIKKILVVAGQEVQKGQLIVELTSPELTKNINEIYHELDELKARAGLDADALRSQINELKAQKISRVTEINYQLKQLQAQYAINRDLTSELQSLEHDSGKTSNEHGGRNPIRIEMERLEKALELEINPLEIRINMLERKLNAPENPLGIQIQRLERELNMLLEEKNKLYIFAQVTGRIGSVQCKAGEQISPFDSILTLHTKSPSYIKCFIHESASANISVGRKVTITSLADSSYHVVGKVVGIGSRIVEYPRRLSRMLAVQTYGREVRVKIPENNNLLLGEKVLVSISDDVKKDSSGFAGGSLSASETQARESVPPSGSGKDLCIHAISIRQSMKDINNIEPSGALYLKDLKKYLIISDTTRNHRPILYLMDEQGNVEDWTLIRGLKEIDDMEAIAEDAEGKIYIACSLSHDGNGKISAARKLLLRLRRDKVFLRLDKKINLYDLLQDAAAHNTNTRWAQFIIEGKNNDEINIEGMFHRDRSLYLGFKRPLKDDKAVVLEISDIDMVFDKGRLDANSIKIWKEFVLTDSADDVSAGISDLHPYEKNLYILSYANINKTGARQKVGNLWAYDLENDSLSHIKRFESLKPEGIAYNVDTDTFLITFDHGRRHPSKIMTWRP